ncbi:methylenetetrahydrofolate reductase [NAD(P)H] [Gordonia sp. PP30]|uniref:methylenetetrahydrofolate reductase [NAD(P)H] n=1 Tax=unclassified Gordonia (in: high G+C Gram-positive bacteria) TaxID=2657482 RepID=UPI001FFFAA46|nr:MULTISPECIES: methylenetetrahydrofolate reductase [NAD(P)H] [unclassified Gordonia (in: high G+C Gram-positive bacteria)]UQE73596.1 methylenetetrahydrofolate reductase [NAD(P)H] [Gordonia sp. PP30]
MSDVSADAFAPSTVVERLAAPHDGPVPFSVEFFPPRTEADEARLWHAVRVFERMDPAFVSLTYGAGGSTRDRTVRIAGDLATSTTLTTVAHLTAVNHSLDELRGLVGAYADKGITNLLALRGDPPGDPLGEWVRHPEGVSYASELVELIGSLGDFHIGVASFPEGHHRAPNLAADTGNLIRKLRSGAEYSVTQIFFDVDDYLRLRDRVVAADPEQGAKPIIPGIMPITSLATVRRMVELSGSVLPQRVAERLAAAAGDGPEEDRAAVREVGIDLCTEMAQRLVAEGAPCLHFCSLNFTRATSEVLERIGIDTRGALTPA